MKTNDSQNDNGTMTSADTCDLRNEEFLSTIGEIQNTMNDPHDFSWTWNCIPCFQTFESYFGWTQHFSNKHVIMLKKLAFQCDCCGDCFFELHSLLHHYQTDHAHISTWCRKCGEKFKFLQSLSKHKCSNKKSCV